PILYHNGILNQWKPGVGAITTIAANTVDFYFSFGLGLTAAIAIIGFWHVFSGLMRRKREIDETANAGVDWKALFRPPAGRGDFPIWIALGIYIFSTTVTIFLAWFLLKKSEIDGGSPVTLGLLGIFVFYGF